MAASVKAVRAVLATVPSDAHAEVCTELVRYMVRLDPGKSQQHVKDHIHYFERTQVIVTTIQVPTVPFCFSRAGLYYLSLTPLTSHTPCFAFTTPPSQHYLKRMNLIPS